MTYSLHTLINPTARAKEVEEPQTFWARFAQEIALLMGGALLLLCILALLSYQASDPAWSTSGSGQTVRNWIGRGGALLADLAYFGLGYSVWWCLAAAARAWLVGLARWMRGSAGEDTSPAAHERRSRWTFWIGLLVLLSASASIEWARLYRLEAHLPGHSGGALGYLVGTVSVRWFGFTGAALVGIALVVSGVAMVFRFSWGQLAEVVGGRIDGLIQSRHEKREIQEDLALGQQALRERQQAMPKQAIEPQWDMDPLAPAPGGQLDLEPLPIPAPQPPAMVIEPAVMDVPRSDRVVKERQKPLFTELPDSKLPQVDLLDSLSIRQETVSPETLEMTSRLIEKKLKDFGVEVRVVAAAPGPVITRYEIEPATGVKGSQVVNLAKDLARSLSLVSIRVIETIPGKNFMALELPNAKRQSIKLSEILGSQVYNEAKSMLTMGLGKDIIGNPVVADLAKMPHVLVAGTTGSGKSVGINAMILSLLYKADPKDVRLLLIDPKMLEMSVYEGIPHLLAPVVTDMKHAANGLNWCVAEMEKRYKLMSKMGVRNLAGFNTKIDEARARGEIIGNPFSLTPEQPEPLERLPYIVVVIDELADLMMVVGKKIEELIARLAQKARAAGIHLILATQRPSVDVITGLIKANLPTRIGFKVASQIDSRTILDRGGAETLIGNGDMLFVPPGSATLNRVQGAFVGEQEVAAIVEFLAEKNGKPEFAQDVIKAIEEGASGGMEGEEGEEGEDPLVAQSWAIIKETGRASVSMLQRRLKLGYNRAARIMDILHDKGYVGPENGSSPREILVE